VNDGRPGGAFLHCRRKARVRIVNNIFYGPGTPWEGGEMSAVSNYIAGSLRNSPRFADPRGYDFHITPGSPDAIVGRGVPPGISSTGFDLTPKQEYVEGAKSKERPVGSALDLGAFAIPSARSPALDADVPRPAATKASNVPKRKTVARRHTPSTQKKATTSSK